MGGGTGSVKGRRAQPSPCRCGSRRRDGDASGFHGKSFGFSRRARGLDADRAGERPREPVGAPGARFRCERAGEARARSRLPVKTFEFSGGEENLRPAHRLNVDRGSHRPIGQVGHDRVVIGRQVTAVPPPARRCTLDGARFAVQGDERQPRELVESISERTLSRTANASLSSTMTSSTRAAVPRRRAVNFPGARSYRLRPR